MKDVKVAIYGITTSTGEAHLPSYQRPGDAGMDLCARLEKPIEIWNGKVAKVPVGIHLAIPEGYEGQIRPRSGMSAKAMICTFGTIDSGFRGELCALIYNLSGSVYTISPGDRIAQLVISEVPRVRWEIVQKLEDLGNTERGTGGFGSTGKQ